MEIKLDTVTFLSSFGAEEFSSTCVELIDQFDFRLKKVEGDDRLY